MVRLFLCLLILTAACGKSGNNGGPSGPNASIAISLSRNTLSIAQGANDNLTASITRSGGFTGTVTIVTEGAPAGVTAAASNVSTSGAVTTGTVTVTVGAAVAPGTYNLTVRASGSGVSDVTQALTLTVTAAPAIALSLSAAAQSVDQGAAGAPVTVTIARTNFAGTVNLTLEGAPVGLTAAFVPAAATATTSVLTVTVGAAVPAAVYNLTVRGTGTGVTDATAVLAVTVTVPASFTLAAAPVTIVQGAQGQSAITIARTNFAAPVTLTLEGAPNGVSGTFDPAQAPGAASTLTLTVGAAVAPAQYPLTVRGAATGVTDRTAAFTLTVTQAVPAGNYTLSTTPSPNLLVGTASGGVAFVVNVNRTGGFTGPVTLAASGLLSSLTATITPAVVTGNTATVTVVPDQSSLVGSSAVTILGTTPGLPNKTAQIQIATAIPDVVFDYSACPASLPLWIGYQDGVTGPWIRLLPLGGKFKIKLTQAKAGFAVVFQGFANNHPTWIRYRSAAELIAITGIELCDQGNPGPKSVIVSTANLGTFESAFISLGGASRQASAFQPTVTIPGVQNGTVDLVATNIFQGFNPSASTARLILLRDLNVPNGQNIGTTIDFTSGLAVAPITATITPTGLVAGDTINSLGTTYSVGASCLQSFLFNSTSGTTAFGVPAAKQRPGDLTGVSFSTSGTTGGFRQVAEYFTGVLSNRSIALPSSAPVPTVSILPGSVLRLRFQYTTPTDLAGPAFFNYGNGTSFDATAAWHGGGAVDIAFPDLSGAADFDLAWLPPSTQIPVSWFFSLAGTGRPNTCVPGRVVGASRNGSAPAP